MIYAYYASFAPKYVVKLFFDQSSVIPKVIELIPRISLERYIESYLIASWSQCEIYNFSFSYQKAL